ncbi:TfoX/Sxy family protein [Pedobacter sp. Hv1]|uniref:TfoX/Sxy family protein n=1 Tax=Pedobacter sp. Hv1 TaxID=1740090 RepID=UPI00128FB3B3|nr:TfoX/Sxy family protein [Pedobacter sp. Hv1]
MRLLLIFNRICYIYLKSIPIYKAMAYNNQLADRVRELLVDEEEVTEKEMFSGVCFMVDQKMCICVSGDELLCRIGTEKVQLELENGNCRNMMNNGRLMKDYVYVEEAGFDQPKKLFYWVKLCLAFNPYAKASKKKQ